MLQYVPYIFVFILQCSPYFTGPRIFCTSPFKYFRHVRFSVVTVPVSDPQVRMGRIRITSTRTSWYA